MKLTAFLILGIIVISLFPVYLFYKYLQRVMRPKESGKNFLMWLLASFLLIFAYTFLLVLVIKILFPGA